MRPHLAKGAAFPLFEPLRFESSGNNTAMSDKLALDLC